MSYTMQTIRLLSDQATVYLAGPFQQKPNLEIKTPMSISI